MVKFKSKLSYEFDDDEFNLEEFMRIVRMSHTYEEFCMNCDMNFIEVIVTEKEFEDMKLLYIS